MNVRTPRVIPTDVDAIADQLYLAGVRPTTLAIRRRLGRGSNTTVSNALAHWRARKAAATAPEVTLTLPEPIIKAVAAWIDAQIAEVTKAANERISEEEAAREASSAHADELEAQVEALTAEREHLREERDQNAGRLAQLGDDRAKERDHLAEAVKAAEDRAHAADIQVASLKVKLASAHKRAAAPGVRTKPFRGQGKAAHG